MNAVFLACAAYFRPIYALFSIYFFLIFYLDLKLSTKLLYYLLINILLSFPALYYLYILNVDFITIHISQKMNVSRFVNQFSVTISIIFFYSIPFLLTSVKDILKSSLFKVENIILSIIFTYLLIYHFNYDLTHGGGIFYKISLLIFDNNYLFYFFSLIALNLLFLILSNNLKVRDKIYDSVLLLVLIFLEPDRIFYHETYDPLLYFIFFLLLKSRFYLNFTEKLTNKKFVLLILFSISFYALSIIKTLYKPIKMPIYKSSDINLFYKAHSTKSII